MVEVGKKCRPRIEAGKGKEKEEEEGLIEEKKDCDICSEIRNPFAICGF